MHILSLHNVTPYLFLSLSLCLCLSISVCLSAKEDGKIKENRPKTGENGTDKICNNFPNVKSNATDSSGANSNVISWWATTLHRPGIKEAELLALSAKRQSAGPPGNDQTPWPFCCVRKSKQAQFSPAADEVEAMSML